MKVIIVGAGEVGYHIIGALYRENVDIVVIDSDHHVLDQLKTEFNISTLLGNATDSSLLQDAGVSEADLFIAVTNYDETNIVACLLAGQVGAVKRIARVKTLDIGHDSSFTEKHHLGIDLIINPYQVAAEHLAHLVEFPQVSDFYQFLSERVLLMRIPIGEGSPLAGKTVINFGQYAQIPQTLIALVQRDGESTIPHRDTVIQPGDQVYFFCERSQVQRLFTYLNLATRPLRRVFINGGGHIGYALARRLEKKMLDVRILEISEERAEWLSQQLDRTLILHVDGCDANALKAEGIEHADYFISVTATEEVNVVSCLLAKEHGAARTLALVKQPEYIPILARHSLIDVAFSPRLLTARKILRFVRGANLDSFFAFVNSDIELLALQIKSGMRCDQVSLAALNLPTGVLIGAVKRGSDIFVPRGDDKLMEGDTILLLQQRRNRRITKSLFLEPGEEPGPVLRDAGQQASA
ncbi:MAG: Trk system potassium transporter TrkA [SAR324 cluster bacterium]|nr:Trk system potassium transporter TrkA [SAR324 cluster bacterium]